MLSSKIAHEQNTLQIMNVSYIKDKIQWEERKKKKKKEEVEIWQGSQLQVRSYDHNPHLFSWTGVKDGIQPYRMK